MLVDVDLQAETSIRIDNLIPHPTIEGVAAEASTHRRTIGHLDARSICAVWQIIIKR